MKKCLLNIFKAVAVATGASFAVGGLIYEGILNIRLANKVIDKLGLADERLITLCNESEIYCSSVKWIGDITPIDVEIPYGENDSTHALVIPSCMKSDKWAVIVHGYNGCGEYMSPYAKHMYDNGYNIIIPALRGHGNDCHSHCSMGYHEKDVVRAWIDYAVKKNPKCEIMILGVSMGSATVMMSTGGELPPNVKCAVADCGYTSCWDEFKIQAKALFHLPAFPLLYTANIISKLSGNFDFKKCSPIDAVAKSKTPTLFIHGDKDDFVPFEMLDKVYDACTADKKKLVIKDAIHASSAIVDPETYFSGLDDFLKEYIG